MRSVFCNMCGNRLDEKTGVCPVCGKADESFNVKEPHAEEYDKTAFYSADDNVFSDTNEKTDTRSSGGKSKNKFILIAVLVFCFVFVFSGVVSLVLFSDNEIFTEKEDDDEGMNKNSGIGDNSGKKKGDYSDEDVPEGAVSFGDHKYYLIDDPSVTDWASAKHYCESRNGYLATISSEEENEFIYNYLKDNYEFSSVYFGMSDASNEGEWKWSNGEKVAYSNWASGEPLNKNSYFDYARFCSNKQSGMWYSGGFGESDQEHIDVSIVSTSATSVLKEENITHDSDKIADGLLSTSWVEGVDSYGVGQAVTLYFDGEYNIDGFVINAGYQRSERLYDKNGRPAEIRLSFSDGTYQDFLLDDIYRSQHIDLINPVITDSVTLTILSTYRGTSFDDTAIAEIAFSAVESNPMFICEWGNYYS